MITITLDKGKTGVYGHDQRGRSYGSTRIVNGTRRCARCDQKAEKGWTRGKDHAFFCDDCVVVQ